MKKFLILILSALCNIPAFSQIKADSIFFYKDFDRPGTTARLHHNHSYLASIQAQTVKLNPSNLADLQALFAESKNKRYYQQKHGGRITYAIVWYNGRKYNYVIDVYDDFAWLIHLGERRKCEIKKPDELEALRALLMKNLS